MNRTAFIWVLENCLLVYDGYSKKDLIEFGSPEESAEMGIKLCEFLKLKECSLCS